MSTSSLFVTWIRSGSILVMRFFDQRNKLKLGCKYSGQVFEDNLAYNSMKSLVLLAADSTYDCFV